MQLSNLLKKEFARIKSDRKVLILLIVIPILAITLFAIATNEEDNSFLSVGIISRDEIATYGNFPTNTSEYQSIFISVMSNDVESSDVVESSKTKNEIAYNEVFGRMNDLLKEDVIDFFIILPNNFSECVKNNTNLNIKYYIDGSNIIIMQNAEIVIQEAIFIFKIEVNSTSNMTVITTYLEFNVPFWESQLLNQIVPIILPLIIFNATINIASSSVVGEKELPRTLMTPTSKLKVMTSKLIANSTIAIMQGTVMFFLAITYGVYCAGSYLDLYLVIVSIAFCGVCIGLFISTLTNSVVSAHQLYALFFVVLSLFSEMFINVDGLPPLIRLIVYAFPINQASDLIKAVVLRGDALSIIGLMGILSVAIVYFVLGCIIYSFKEVKL